MSDELTTLATRLREAIYAGDALTAIMLQRDYHAEAGHYLEGTMGPDQEFDDWAADIAQTALEQRAAEPGAGVSKAELASSLQGLYDCDALEMHRRDDNPQWDSPEVAAARRSLERYREGSPGRFTSISIRTEDVLSLEELAQAEIELSRLHELFGFETVEIVVAGRSVNLSIDRGQAVEAALAEVEDVGGMRP